MRQTLKCPGVGRDKDCLSALQFYFNRPVTDDEMRFLHEVMQRAVAISLPSAEIGSRARRRMTGFWMHETSGVLRPAVEAYLSGAEMQPQHIAAMRAYLRQWITGDWALTEGISKLRRDIDTLVDRDSIAKWLNVAIEEGIDPL